MVWSLSVVVTGDCLSSPSLVSKIVSMPGLASGLLFGFFSMRQRFIICLSCFVISFSRIHSHAFLVFSLFSWLSSTLLRRVLVFRLFCRLFSAVNSSRQRNRRVTLSAERERWAKMIGTKRTSRRVWVILWQMFTWAVFHADLIAQRTWTRTRTRVRRKDVCRILVD